MIEYMLYLSVVLNVIIAYRCGYYKGKSEEDNSGWEDEAIFWRNVIFPENEKDANNEN